MKQLWSDWKDKWMGFIRLSQPLVLFFFVQLVLCPGTSNGGLIGSMPACGPRDMISNPAWGKFKEDLLPKTN